MKDTTTFHFHSCVAPSESWNQWFPRQISICHEELHIAREPVNKMLNILTSHIIVSVVNSTIYLSQFILWDPGAYSGGKGKTEQAEKNGAKKSKERLFFAPFFSARLVFPLPPLSASGSQRMLPVLSSLGNKQLGCRSWKRGWSILGFTPKA